jgi:ABC-type enterochelin transport system permease subunit
MGYGNYTEALLGISEKFLIDSLYIYILYLTFPYKLVESYRAWPQVNDFILSVTELIFFTIIILVTYVTLENKNKLRNPIVLLFVVVIYVIIFINNFNNYIAVQNKFSSLNNPFFADFINNFSWYFVENIGILIIVFGVFSVYKKLLRIIDQS